MFLAEHSGPKAQIIYKGDKEKEFLCNIPEVFSVYSEPGARAQIENIFVQNTASIDWEKPAGHWIEATKAFYVTESDLMGAMGSTYAPFKDRASAERFQKDHGGKIFEFDELLSVSLQTP